MFRVAGRADVNDVAGAEEERNERKKILFKKRSPKPTSLFPHQRIKCQRFSLRCRLCKGFSANEWAYSIQWSVCTIECHRSDDGVWACQRCCYSERVSGRLDAMIQWLHSHSSHHYGIIVLFMFNFNRPQNAPFIQAFQSSRFASFSSSSRSMHVESFIQLVRRTSASHHMSLVIHSPSWRVRRIFHIKCREIPLNDGRIGRRWEIAGCWNLY